MSQRTDRPDPATGKGSGRAITGMPLWVKISGIVVGIVAVVIAAMLIFGGGQHGPGRHTPPGPGQPTATMPAGHQPPPGGHG
ncbi:MAG TPA: hypothetical protein VGR06_26705 [Actinophytocola sp.]|jgi:hypothetical protein|uniref:hypothetical protein n=1 Tax=Actinophytocola sp. TaxID=1872138 RepID=UPI002E0B62E4|nr:hypothetical protein [Actinophytocola sp.]